MKPLALMLLVICSMLAMPQEQSKSAPSANQIVLSAEQEITQGVNVKLRGHVQIETGSVIVSADEADYDPMTGQINPRGHVRVRLRNVMPQLKIEDSNPQDTPVSDGK
jgi:lipopolysaccharide assembly outer membrane protein LptD (OstA)